jgi:hypothetical protein
MEIMFSVTGIRIQSNYCKIFILGTLIHAATVEDPDFYWLLFGKSSQDPFHLCFFLSK